MRGGRKSPTLIAALMSVLAILLAFCLSAVVSGPSFAKPSDPPTPPPGPPVHFIANGVAAPPPELDAYSWVIADADSGHVLAVKGGDHRLPQASTTKVLTALTVLPRLDPAATYTAIPKDQNAEGAHAGIEAGATYTVGDLLHGLMLPSGNDAASALANANGGWDVTVAQMNEVARGLGAYNTTVRNPSGLDQKGHFSTAIDLAVIFRAALPNPTFRQLIGAKTYEFPASMPKPGKKRKSYQIYNLDRLLQQDYPGMIGGKTGYTTNAGRTFVGAATHGDRTLIISIMRTTQPLDEAGRKLLNWGFANSDKATPVGQLPTADTPSPTQPATSDELSSGTVPVAAAVVTAGGSSVDLPWLTLALATFLTLLVIAVILRIRQTIRRNHTAR